MLIMGIRTNATSDPEPQCMIPLSGIRRYCDTESMNSMYDSVVVLGDVGQAAMNRSSFELNREYTTQSA